MATLTASARKDNDSSANMTSPDERSSNAAVAVVLTNPNMFCRTASVVVAGISLINA